MPTPSDLPNRKTLRLKGYDYSHAGAYFVTICTANKKPLLGSIVDGHVTLSPAGEIVRAVWNALPSRFPRLLLDEFVIMPNHFHAVLAFVGEGLAPPAATIAKLAPPGSAPLAEKSANCSIPDVIGAFKSISTIQVNRHLRTKGSALWQRSYHDHIVRTGEDMGNIQRYIFENPLLWSSDPENPNQSSS